MPLTSDEIAAFTTDGLIIKRHLVPDELVERAATLVAAWYRDDMDHSRLIDYTQRTFAPDLGNHPDILALFTGSGVADLVADLVGNHAPITIAQIQIRVPAAESQQPQPAKAMHVDGVSCPHLDPSELRTFSLIVGVALSDIDNPVGGALHYVPGGHLRMAEWFRTEWSLGITDQVPPQIGVEQGIPLLGKPGDVLIMHHLVPHSVGTNHGHTPRVMVYFRVSHVDHPSRRLDALRDPWLDFPALANQIR